MASPGTNLVTQFTEIFSTTFRAHTKEIADNIGNHNALWRRLNKKGQIKAIPGGADIQVPLIYAANGTYQRYSGGLI